MNFWEVMVGKGIGNMDDLVISQECARDIIYLF